MSALDPSPSSPLPKDFDWEDFKSFTQWLHWRFSEDEKGPWHKDEVGKNTERSRENVARFRMQMECLPEGKQGLVRDLLDKMETLLTLSEGFAKAHESLGQKAAALDLMRGGLFED